MIFRRNKDRVEEDLQKIRQANLSPEKFEEECRIKKQKTESTSMEKLHLEKNDLLAMVLAVFSLVLPFILIFIAIMGIFVFLMCKLYI